EYIREAIAPTALPAPFAYYGFYWGTNERGTYSKMPLDTYWALGLGDSFVVFCPSLDLVAVRLGNGNRGSHLPGPEGNDNWSDDWGGRVEGFFSQIVDAVNDPYPASEVVKRVIWAPVEEIVKDGDGADNWPLTWGDDDAQYTAYGDGWGFKSNRTVEKLSVGVGRVFGTPPDFTAENIRSNDIERPGDGARGAKASGILMVDGVLYMWMRNADNSTLTWSNDHGKTWVWSDWKFSASFGCPTFLNFGQNYEGARDDYVYIYSFDSDTAYDPADRLVLARVPRNEIRNNFAYEYFQTTVGDNIPVWTKRLDQRGAIFEYPGKCYRLGVTYNAGLGRYILCQVIPNENHRFTGREGDMRFVGGFGIYDAPEPWGPWTTVYYTNLWDVGPGESASQPVKWMSADGRTNWHVYSGDDYFAVRKVEYVTNWTPKTKIALDDDGRWTLNGKVTYPGAQAEGLLMNVRMVNSTFEDRKRPDFDADANTERFLSKIPEYVALGARAFTLNLQGGMPGYEGAVNSAINPDGSLQAAYLARIRRVIEACDENGAAVILGIFYQRQDGIFENDDAIRNAVRNAMTWVRDAGFTNVLIEIANEYDHSGFDHAVIKSVEGELELIALAREIAPELLISTSGLGHGRMEARLCEAVDFIMPHYNGTPVDDIPGRIEALKKYGKPIVCNEDDKIGEKGAAAARLSVENGASWGFMAVKVNQHQPFVFDGYNDDPAVYDMLKSFTSP
ncbi:MAG: hypothetical protein O3A46_09815, partial [Candidatus Poribacteria bacterium]|nr:hypothetical protein [Candidatus Poribacteria bacterium]